MFGKVLYCDVKKISDYKAIINNKKNIKINSLELSDEKDAGVDIQFLKGKKSNTKTINANIEESILYDCAEFEKLLEGRDDYIDFSINDNDIYTISRGHIIRFDGVLHIPQSFDMIQLIEQYKPLLISEATIDMSDIEGNIVRTCLESTNMKIPLLFDIDNTTLVSKICSQNLLVDYNELEEYEEVECTVLARMISSNLINKCKPIYDPLRDFIVLNRQARRGFADNRPSEFKELYCENDYKTIEILAIYQ